MSLSPAPTRPLRRRLSDALVLRPAVLLAVTVALGLLSVLGARVGLRSARAEDLRQATG